MEAKKDINEQFANFKLGIDSAMGTFDKMMENLMPQSTPKDVTIEIVVKTGTFGFGRKVKKLKATAYISMNSILNLDFKDKNEMKEFFDTLK